MNCANNHLPDGGIDGMLATDALLDQASLVHAGTGQESRRSADGALFGNPRRDGLAWLDDKWLSPR